jgi:Transport protein Avl9
LFPGAISFNYAGIYADYQKGKPNENLSQVLCYLRSLKEYRMPLQIFNSQTLFIPLLVLQEVDILDKCKGMLVGTTNPLFLNFPKGRADIVINLDKDIVDYPNEKGSGHQSQMIKLCRQHTSYEKKFLA